MDPLELLLLREGVKAGLQMVISYATKNGMTVEQINQDWIDTKAEFEKRDPTLLPGV